MYPTAKRIWQNAPVLALLLTVAQIGAPNITRVDPACPAFALTFDAHEAAQGASQLLDLLHERGLRATLFVTGRFAERYPALVRRAAAEGHEIGNHSYSHPHLTTWASNGRHDTRPGVTREWLQDELRRAALAIEAAIGGPPAPLWRAPYGEHNPAIRAWAAELGLLHVDWTRADGDALDALDWVEDPRSRRFMGPEAMARRLLRFEARTGVPLAGSIVLMHLGSPREDQPLLEALPIFLDETDRRGLQPRPVGELLRCQGATTLAPPPAPPVSPRR